MEKKTRKIKKWILNAHPDKKKINKSYEILKKRNEKKKSSFVLVDVGTGGGRGGGGGGGGLRVILWPREATLMTPLSPPKKDLSTLQMKLRKITT